MHERTGGGSAARRLGAVAGLRRCAVLHAACLHSRGQRRVDGRRSYALVFAICNKGKKHM
ncbi:hypothetical protein BDA96_03G288800 [Sorghum bicolor]|uniref:Uncharacterized protein n=2 Tax=Sorghum bicolor TaxID=4558 RepID=A0A921RH66_SORBI|nr:hypothetical protein BDA96_03G288800 [Sorghum bicolor]KXG33189.1 hypothetical protein SORBI_3003G267200 [Sorghum bicolor]